jgi:hypothetical protein
MAPILTFCVWLVPEMAEGFVFAEEEEELVRVSVCTPADSVRRKVEEP